MRTLLRLLLTSFVAAALAVVSAQQMSTMSICPSAEGTEGLETHSLLNGSFLIAENTTRAGCRPIPCPGVGLLVLSSDERCAGQLRNLSRATILRLGEFTHVCALPRDASHIDSHIWACSKQAVPMFAPGIARSMKVLAEPWSLSPTSTVKDAFVEEITEAGEEGRYLALISSLSGKSEVKLGAKGSFSLKTRYTFTEDNSLAAQWISAFFDLHGADEVIEQPFTMPDGSPTANVIAVHYGTSKRDEVVVVGAHFDSISQSPLNTAPGAVDNGSGTAALLLMAQAMNGIDFARTVHLVAFSGEEQGLYGSKHYVTQALKDGLNIKAALTMDMIAYSSRYFGVIIEGTKDEGVRNLANQVQANLKTYSPRLAVVLSEKSFGSDHVSFQLAGIPAILAIEQDDTDYPDYHRSTDSVANCNEEQAISIVKGLGGALYDLCQ